MLDRIRRHAYSWTTRITLGLITVVFMFWGIGTGFFAQVHPVASVNGDRILADQVEREVNNLRRTLQSVYGADAPNVLKSVNLRQEALDRIIENQLISDEARHLGIQVSQAELEQKIGSETAFRRDGQFDLTTYQEVLRDNGLLPTEYEASMRESMITDTLRQMIDDGVQVSPDEVRHAYDLRSDKIALNYIEVPFQSFVPRISPTEQQLSDYYQKYREAFREPERVKVALIHYQPLTLAAKLVPTDREIKDYYDRNLKSRFTHPEQVHAHHILIEVPETATAQERTAARAKADDVLRQAKSGSDFDKLANKYSDDSSNALKGGDLGWFGRGQMIKPFEDTAFAMKAGDIQVVETKFGYHVVKLDEHKAAGVDTLEQARPQIIKLIQTEAGTRLARRALDDDLSAARDGESLADIAKKQGLDVIETSYLAGNEAIAGVQDSRPLLDAAFKLEKGQVRAVPAGGAPYLIKLLDRTPSRIPPFKEIESTKVREVYVRTTAESEARNQAQKVLEQIKSPADFDRVAAASGLAVRHIDLFQRSTHSLPGIGEFPEVTDAAGAVANVPGIIDRVMENGGNSYIFEVSARAEPTDKEWKGAEQEFTGEYLAQRRAQAWTRFVDDLKTHADIVIHTDQLGTASESSM